MVIRVQIGEWRGGATLGAPRNPSAARATGADGSADGRCSAKNYLFIKHNGDVAGPDGPSTATYRASTDATVDEAVDEALRLLRPELSFAELKAEGALCPARSQGKTWPIRRARGGTGAAARRRRKQTPSRRRARLGCASVSPTRRVTVAAYDTDAWARHPSARCDPC